MLARCPPCVALCIVQGIALQCRVPRLGRGPTKIQETSWSKLCTWKTKRFESDRLELTPSQHDVSHSPDHEETLVKCHRWEVEDRGKNGLRKKREDTAECEINCGLYSILYDDTITNAEHLLWVTRSGNFENKRTNKTQDQLLDLKHSVMHDLLQQTPTDCALRAKLRKERQRNIQLTVSGIREMSCGWNI